MDINRALKLYPQNDIVSLDLGHPSLTCWFDNYWFPDPEAIKNEWTIYNYYYLVGSRKKTITSVVFHINPANIAPGHRSYTNYRERVDRGDYNWVNMGYRYNHSNITVNKGNTKLYYPHTLGYHEAKYAIRIPEDKLDEVIARQVTDMTDCLFNFAKGS